MIEFLIHFSTINFFWPLATVLAIFTTFSCFITIRRAISISIYRLRTKDIHRVEETILKYLEAPQSKMPEGLPKNGEIRDMLVALGKRFDGDLKHRLQRLYTTLGFHKSDLRALMGWGFRGRMQALYRFRVVGNLVPEKAWPKLLRVRNLEFRWAFMEYLIQQKGKAAIPWLMGFITNPENEKRGIVLHLLCCIAKTSPETISMLIEYSDNDFLREQALRALVVYPIPGMERHIIKSIRKSSSEEMLLAGIKALISHPHGDWLHYIESFISHPNWVVRMLIARGIENYPGSRGLDLLEQLSEDLSYHVRLAAIQNLIKLKPTSQDILKYIQNNPGHPSFYIYSQLSGTDGLTGKPEGKVA